jgi:hypothetical protein
LAVILCLAANETVGLSQLRAVKQRKPSNAIEKFHNFAVLERSLPLKYHIVARAGRDEDDGGDVVETLDPLAPLVALTTHVEHAAERRANVRHRQLVNAT